jgi:hypothetical protein
VNAPIRHNGDLRGHRLPETLHAIARRDELICEAARRYFPGASDREIARQLRTALSRYREGRWRRDRSESLCPHAGKLPALLWCLLKTRDAVPSDRTIRLALARR